MDETQKELRLQVLLTEYQYVSGLIPLYREVEAKALSTTGIVLAAIASLVAALSQIKDPDLNAQGAIVSLSSWLLVLFAAVEVTAQLRIIRASRYLRDVLYPRVSELVGEDALGFESTSGLSMIAKDKTRIHEKSISNVLRANLLTSAPISLGIGVTGLVLPFVGLIWIAGTPLFSAFSNQTAVWFSLGLLGGLVSLSLGIMGYILTRSVEFKKTSDL